MLYIFSALEPSAKIYSLSITGLGNNSTALIISVNKNLSCKGIFHLRFCTESRCKRTFSCTKTAIARCQRIPTQCCCLVANGAAVQTRIHSTVYSRYLPQRRIRRQRQSYKNSNKYKFFHIFINLNIVLMYILHAKIMPIVSDEITDNTSFRTPSTNHHPKVRSTYTTGRAMCRWERWIGGLCRFFFRRLPSETFVFY